MEKTKLGVQKHKKSLYFKIRGEQIASPNNVPAFVSLSIFNFLARHQFTFSFVRFSHVPNVLLPGGQWWYVDSLLSGLCPVRGWPMLHSGGKTAAQQYGHYNIMTVVRQLWIIIKCMKAGVKTAEQIYTVIVRRYFFIKIN